MEKRNNLEIFFKGLFKKSLKNQIENYATLSLYKSARGIATILMLLSAVITLTAIMAGLVSFNGWIVILLTLILAFFVYKGKKWAMIVVMVCWTFGKVLQVLKGNFSVGFIIMIIIGWGVFMLIIGYAYWIERIKSLGVQLPKE